MRRVAAAVTLAVAALAGCGSDDDATADTTVERDDDAETAWVVCEGLRAHDNMLVDTVNDAVADIGAQTPTERADTLIGAFESLGAVAETFGADIAEWPVPEVPERAALLAELQAGAEASVAELVDEATTFGTPSEITDDDVHGQVGVLFNALEKAMSVLEPRIAAYDRTAFQQAFVDEPACRHVVQPFTVD